MPFHVVIYVRGADRPQFELDITEEDLERRFVGPVRRRQPIMINGLIVSADELKGIKIFEGSAHSREIIERVELEHADRGLPIFDRQRLALEAVARTQEVTAVRLSEPPPAQDRKKIFLIHGRWKEAWQAMQTFLWALGLEPFGWEQARLYGGREGQHNSDILDNGFKMAYAVVIFMTPDDQAVLHPDLARWNGEDSIGGQPRPNVFFEAGYAWHAIRERTLIVEFGEIKKLSDLSGVDRVRFDGSPASRNEVADRLRRINAAVKTEGGQYLHAGDFPTPLPKLAGWPGTASAARNAPDNGSPRGTMFAALRRRKNGHP